MRESFVFPDGKIELLMRAAPQRQERLIAAPSSPDCHLISIPPRAARLIRTRPGEYFSKPYVEFTTSGSRMGHDHRIS